MTCFDKAAGGFACSSLILKCYRSTGRYKVFCAYQTGLDSRFLNLLYLVELTRVGVKYYGLALFWTLVGKSNYDITQIVYF